MKPFILLVSTVGWKSCEDIDVEMEGATGEVESSALARVLRQVARPVLLALQLDI